MCVGNTQATKMCLSQHVSFVPVAFPSSVRVALEICCLGYALLSCSCSESVQRFVNVNGNWLQHHMI